MQTSQLKMEQNEDTPAGSRNRLPDDGDDETRH